MSISKRLRSWYYEAFDLHALERRSRAARGDPEAPVVSLTSVPARIARIKPTLVSLLRQTLAPREIQLNLSREYFQATELPAFLTGLDTVTVHWTDRDHGPATKFIPTLARYDGTDQLIIVCDDDMFYHRDLVRTLCRADREAGGHSVFCANGFNVPDDFDAAAIPTDRALPCGQRRVAVVEGCGGYTLRSRLIDWTTLLRRDGAPERFLFDDDIWLSGHLSRRHVAKYQVAVGRRRSLSNTIESAIKGNRKQLQADLMAYFGDDWAPEERVTPMQSSPADARDPSQER